MARAARFDRPGPPMGLSCERGPELLADTRRFAAPILLVPLEATVVAVALEDGSTLSVDKASVLLLPAGAAHRIESASALAHLATFVLHEEVRLQAVAEYTGELDFARMGELFAAAALLPRTIWVNELCHRYVFERTHCDKHATLAARFVELELTKELFFLCGERAARVERASVVRSHDPIVERALAYLEQRLFDPLGLASVARHAGASPSTLLRAFKRAVGASPSSYLRGRRLDEAMLLLKSRRYTVGEVAERVGYQSLASFTHAFSRHFGELPSAVRVRAR
jgi:AraC-like DNA-binding protein